MRRRDFLRSTAIVAAAACLPPRAAPRGRSGAATGRLEESDVFVSGDGYPTYRIPSLLVSARGTVLAFAEGRQEEGDHAQNDLVLRRSTDGGRQWGARRLVAEDGPNVLVNPTAVEDRGAGRLWLMYQRYPAGFHEREVVPGYDGDRVCRAYATFSDDDGRSWSPPREVTRSVKRPLGVTSIASGPGVGIQLRRGSHRGRLVVPFNEGPVGAWKVYAAYSDDGGASWRHGDVAPDPAGALGNEVQMVELSDGAVMLNARSQGSVRARLVATSRDGGHTWSPLAPDAALPDPQCQATLVRHDDRSGGGEGPLLFANPASRTHRVNGTVRVSADDGRTWPESRVVHAGPFAYSCLATLGGGAVGLLYERDGYDRITFARMDLAWLTGGA